MTDYILTDNILRAENPIENHCLFIQNAIFYKVPKGKMTFEEMEIMRHPRIIEGMLKLYSTIIKSEVDKSSDKDLDKLEKWMEGTSPEWRIRVRNAPENLKTSLINGDYKTLKVELVNCIRHWMEKRVIERMSRRSISS
jgi:hypothetical protein